MFGGYGCKFSTGVDPSFFLYKEKKCWSVSFMLLLFYANNLMRQELTPTFILSIIWLSFMKGDGLGRRARFVRNNLDQDYLPWIVVFLLNTSS